MVAFKNVAHMSFVDSASDRLAHVGARMKKVPLRYWRMAALAVLLFWMVHTLAVAFWRLVPAPELPVPQVVPVNLGSESGPERTVDIEAVQALHLFGDYNAPAVAEKPPEEEIPEVVPVTKLNLELQGLVASNNPEKSWAIIGSSNNQKLYKIGEEVEGVRGVKIARIHDVKVILDNNGRLEELWLYGEDGMNVASDSEYTPPPEPQDQSQTEATISRDQIAEARNIGDVVRFMVATENGRMIGYKVRPGRKRELFDQVGLKPDDIVVSVNGIEVNEPQKVREVYQALKTASQANLQVMRDGTTQFIQISMSSEG